WRQQSQRILLRQLRRQVLADGVYFEQASCYQHYTVETYLHWLILAARNGLAVPASVGECVQRMLDFLLALRRPDGSVPQIGDADGGRLLPLLRRSPEDFRGLFAIAAAWFRRPDYAWAAGGMAPEVPWLLGEAGELAFERMTPAKPHKTSRLFRHGGYAVMRDSWEPRGHQLIFDVGPLGCPLSGGHGHADLLSIQCSTFGETHLPDPGTYCYTADPHWRDYFRGTSAHSTVTVDGQNQAVPSGAFSWRRRPQARLNRWQSGAEFDLADAEHDAYFSLSDPVVHRRRVFFAKPRYWLIVDDLRGLDLHEIQLRFQFALTTVVLDRSGWVHSCGASGAGLLLRAFAAVAIKADLQHGNTEPHQGWLSPDYGQLQPAPMLRYTCTAQLPLRIVTLLLPVADALGAPPPVSEQFSDGELRLVFRDKGEAVRVSGHSIVLERLSTADPGSRNE
ncbi:MAG: alginate lyase family protein, partial [Gammaproteobacteria bacterium]